MGKPSPSMLEAALQTQENAVPRVDCGHTAHQWHGNRDVSCRTGILRDSVAKDNGGEGRGEIAQQLKCLLHKHEDWNLDLQNPRKCQVGFRGSCIRPAFQRQKEVTPSVSCQAAPRHIQKLRVNCLSEQSGERFMRKNPRVSLGSPHSYTHGCGGICTHTHTRDEK